MAFPQLISNPLKTEPSVETYKHAESAGDMSDIDGAVDNVMNTPPGTIQRYEALTALRKGLLKDNKFSPAERERFKEALASVSETADTSAEAAREAFLKMGSKLTSDGKRMTRAETSEAHAMYAPFKERNIRHETAIKALKGLEAFVINEAQKVQ